MKCSKCGFENKDSAKFCTKCGNSFVKVHKVQTPQNSNNNSSKGIIIALIVIIIILIAGIGYFALNMNGQDSQSSQSSDEVVQENVSQAVQSQDSEEAESENVHTQTLSSSQVSDSKSWESIGSYSGSGSGSKTISVPAGKIMVKLSAYPIKNYATNHLYVSGSNGQSGGVDWGSKSAVETRSDSFTYTSDSSETFTIEYYETVSWDVEFFRYQ